jgi:hypothetical protein
LWFRNDEGVKLVFLETLFSKPTSVAGPPPQSLPLKRELPSNIITAVKNMKEKII